MKYEESVVVVVVFECVTFFGGGVLASTLVGPFQGAFWFWPKLLHIS